MVPDTVSETRTTHHLDLPMRRRRPEARPHGVCQVHHASRETRPLLLPRWVPRVLPVVHESLDGSENALHAPYECGCRSQVNGPKVGD